MTPAAETFDVERRDPEADDEIILAGVRCRVVYFARGPYVRADRKGAIENVGFLGVEPA